MTERHGGCLCGQVRYRLTADPVRTLPCWCRDCQRLAANGTVNALVPAGALVIEGDLREYGSVADSAGYRYAVRRFSPCLRHPSLRQFHGFCAVHPCPDRHAGRSVIRAATGQYLGPAGTRLQRCAGREAPPWTASLWHRVRPDYPASETSHD